VQHRLVRGEQLGERLRVGAARLVPQPAAHEAGADHRDDEQQRERAEQEG
jgi:hypothetical protein